MSFLLKTLGWIGIGLVAWMLLSVACLSVMYARAGLSPKRAARIRGYENAHGGGDAAVGEPQGEGAALASIVRSRWEP